MTTIDNEFSKFLQFEGRSKSKKLLKRTFNLAAICQRELEQRSRVLLAGTGLRHEDHRLGADLQPPTNLRKGKVG